MVLDALIHSRVLSGRFASCSLQSRDTQILCKRRALRYMTAAAKQGALTSAAPVAEIATGTKETEPQQTKGINEVNADSSLETIEQAQDSVFSMTRPSALRLSPFRQKARERQELHSKVSALQGRPFTSAFLAEATGVDVSELGLQNPNRGRIAYQGAPGAFSEALASQLCPDLEPLGCAQYEDAFMALLGFAADRALVPIENSLGGSIHEVLDLFIRYNVTIEREAFCTIRQCLVALPGTMKDDIRRVLSDTTSLLQCNQYLRAMQGVRREAVGDTAAAAQLVAKSGWRDVAAIASEAAAELYGLEVLERNIQDNKDGNITRFFLLTRDAVKWVAEENGPQRMSIVFSFPEQAGQLFNALSAFALRDINLTKIESRPFKDDPVKLGGIGRRFQYRFYIDFAGGLGSAAIQNAIVHLQEIAPFVKILGCYPMDMSNSALPSPIVHTPAAEEVTEQLQAGLQAEPEPLVGSPDSMLWKGGNSADLLVAAAAAGNVRPIQQDMPHVGTLSVAYQGMPGAYSESAVLAAFPDAHPVPCEQFEDAFQALSQYLTDRAVLPIQNSLGGSIHAVYDLLIQYKLYIIGEVTVKVNHCLLALPGVAKADLRRVISHYQALAQVDGYTRGLPGVVREAVDDTAGAARMVAKNGWRDTAAVASARAGQLYGLEPLDVNIQDNKNNITRFLILSRDPRVQSPSDTRMCKTSVVFSLKEGPGELFKACSVFALRGLNMTNIESRPMRMGTSPASSSSSSSKNGGFRYLFYIDFIASMADAKGQYALRHLSELATFMRVLGCYPMDSSQD